MNRTAAYCSTGYLPRRLKHSRNRLIDIEQTITETTGQQLHFRLLFYLSFVLAGSEGG